LDKTGKIKKIPSYKYLGIDFEQNVYVKSGNWIEVRKWRDSTFVANLDFSNFGYNPPFIPLTKDTFLLGNDKGVFYKLTPTMDPIILPNLSFGGVVQNYSIINISPNYFFIKNKGLYSRKTLKLVLPAAAKETIQEIDGKFYVFGNSVQEYIADSIGTLKKTATTLTQYSKKGMLLYDFKAFKNQWLVCGASPYYSSSPNSSSYQEFHGVVDSFKQEPDKFHDISFNISPQQKQPAFDTKCRGYLFENINFLIENKGKDTLQSLSLIGGTYEFGGVWCYAYSNDFWNLENLAIPPQTTITYQIANFCVKGFTKKDSTTRTLCIIAASPNDNLDIQYSDNRSCYDFSKTSNEVGSKDTPPDLDIKIYNDENTLYLQGSATYQRAKLLLYSIDGRLLKTENIGDVLPQQIDISYLQKGLYIAQLILDNQYVINKKIVK
jgi:hypothetical protein